MRIFRLKFKIRRIVCNYKFYLGFALFLIFNLSLISYSQNASVFYKKVTFKSECECKKNEKITLLNDGLNVYSIYESPRTIEKLPINDLREVTCNAFDTFRRGPNQKVIGISVYEIAPTLPKHVNILKDLAVQLKDIYPGWTLRVYHDEKFNKTLKCEIECLEDQNGILIDNTDFCDIQSIPKISMISSHFIVNSWSASYIHNGMWRWLSIGDSNIDIFMSRDRHSFITEREVSAVNEWLMSDKFAHKMRDSPIHKDNIISADLWGIRIDRDRQLAKKLYMKLIDTELQVKYNRNNQHGSDSKFVSLEYNPLIINSLIAHESYGCTDPNISKPFPTKRKGGCYVGRPHDPYYNCEDICFFDCKIECRPKNHLDWKSC